MNDQVGSVNQTGNTGGSREDRDLDGGPLTSAAGLTPIEGKSVPGVVLVDTDILFDDAGATAIAPETACSQAP